MLAALAFGAGFSSLLFKATDKSGKAEQEYYKMKTNIALEQQKKERIAAQTLEQQSVKPGGRQRPKTSGRAILGSPYLMDDSMIFNL